MFRDCRSFKLYDINEEMCLLGFLGIVVDGNNLEGVKNDLTRSAGVHDWPVVPQLISYGRTERGDGVASRQFIAKLV